MFAVDVLVAVAVRRSLLKLRKSEFTGDGFIPICFTLTRVAPLHSELLPYISLAQFFEEKTQKQGQLNQGSVSMHEQKTVLHRQTTGKYFKVYWLFSVLIF